MKTVRRLYPKDPREGGLHIKKAILILVNLIFIFAAAWYLKDRYDESQRQSTRALYVNPTIEMVDKESTSEDMIYSSENQITTDSLLKK